MALTRIWKSLQVVNLRHQPWAILSAIAPNLDPSQLIEEEKTPYYRPDRFYPVRLGEVLRGRYQIALKLGYGTSSTVWLARDLHRYRWQSERYVAIKVGSKKNAVAENGSHREVAMLRRIATANTQHKGWHFVRKLADSFNISGPGCEHTCLVFEPMREPLWLYCRRYVGNIIPVEILKIIVQMVLHGLDYLHSECQIIHTDLKPDNIMMRVEDPVIFQRAAEDEYRNPLPQKTIDERIIYLSRNDYGIPSVPIGVVQITDFDLSVLGDVPRDGCIQADVYRAPEVILDAGYTYSADIWNLGVILWDLLEGNKLFHATSTDGADQYDEHLHLAQITALLGPCPSELACGKRHSRFYESPGNPRKSNTVPRNFTFEDTIRQIKGEEKEMFIKCEEDALMESWGKKYCQGTPERSPAVYRLSSRLMTLTSISYSKCIIFEEQLSKEELHDTCPFMT